MRAAHGTSRAALAATLLHAWIATPFGLTLLAGLTVLACGEAKPRPNVILISLDTLRADALGTYGATAAASPQLDAFLSESVVLGRAYSPEPHTLPAHTTLFTSLHPTSHGVTGHLAGGIALPQNLPTLAQTLQKAGFATAAFINGGFLHPRFGLNRGFDDYNYFSDIATRSSESGFGRTAAETNEAVFDWLDRHPNENFFLFIHYFDVHSDTGPIPYDSPQSYRKGIALDPDWAQSGGSAYLENLNQTGKRLAPAELARLRGLYQAGLRYTDDQFGELVSGLRARGLYDGALIVLVADHGEEFQEHGKLLHSQLYEENLHIPMGLRFPSGSEIGARTLDAPVGLADVMPTVLSILGIESPAGLQGRSLIPLISNNETWKSKPLFFVSAATGQIAMQNDVWKLIYNPRTEAAKLYDRTKDSAEANDLAESNPKAKRVAIKRLRKWFRSAPRRHRETRPSKVTLDTETIQQLEALGYANPEDPGP
jgi:arylsulfatase A-like enzyme